MATLRSRSFVVFAVLISAACYSHRPVSGAPAVNTRIAADLTDTGSLAMAQLLGPAATTVEGTVRAADQSAVTLNVLRVHYRGGTSMTWTGESVRFPTGSLRDIRERRLDRTRSWMAGGLITLGAILVAAVTGIVSGDDDAPPGGGVVPPN